MDFSVNLNFDFNGPSMENAVNDPNQAGKANLTNNQTLISPSQQITASTSFNNHNSSNVETVDLSSGIVGTANSKEFQLNSENNNQMLGNRNVKANEMEAISNTTMTQSNQTVTSTNTQKNNMNNTSVNENYKTNTTMESMGKNDIPSIANKNENSNQTKMDMSNDSNKSISINGKNTVQSEIKNIGNSKENSLDIKMNNNTNTGMNGNTSMAGTEKPSIQEESSSQITIETLGDDFPNTTIESISTEKAQVINTDEGGFKSLQVETVKVDEKDMEETGGIIGGIVSFFTELINEIEELVNSWRESISAWWNEEVAPLFKDISDKIGDFLIGTASTIVTGVISIYEGILSFGEAIFDTGVIVLTALASVGTGIFDLCQALYGSVTGEEWESITKKMWDGTMGFVATEQVKSLFDDFYENTEIGQFLKENTNLFGIIDFNTIRSIGSGIGYTTGVVALTVLTFGVGGAAISGSSITVNATQLATTAGIAGFGRGTESAWKDGASLGEGFLFGGLNAIWEGFQFYIGGKIGGIGNAGNTFLGYSTKGFENQFVNALVRITLDGLDGGLEGFVQPIMATVYKDGYTTSEGEYVEFTSDTNFFERATKLFDSYGGWGNVATQAFVGSAMSTLGEGFDLRRYLKEGKEPYLISEHKTEVSKNKLDLNSLDTLDDNLHYDTMEFNAKELKSEILDTINQNWTTVEKIRKLYIELNKRLGYDINYPDADRTIKSSIYNNVQSFEKLKSKFVICKGWSELYRELLIDSGIEERKVKIMSPGGNAELSHRWVEIEIDDNNIIIADATDVINHAIDLSNCKAGFATNGLFYLPKDYSGTRLNSLKIDYDNLAKYQWFEIDNKLGYTSGGLYLSELVSEATVFFNKFTGLFDKFSTLKYERINDMVNQIYEMDIPKNMDGYETYAYYQKIKRLLLPNGEANRMQVNLWLNKISEGYEGITIVIMGTKYLTYSESTGKHIFDNIEDYKEFINGLELRKLGG